MAKRSLIKLVTGGYEEVDAPEEERTEVKADTRAAASSVEEEWSEGEGSLSVDVYQMRDEIVIKSTIAGVNTQNLDITITSDMVTIRGERERDETVNPEDYYHQELYWGAFSRTIVLPQEIDTEAARAALKDGILTVRLPKLERSRTKKLRIN